MNGLCLLVATSFFALSSPGPQGLDEDVALGSVTGLPAVSPLDEFPLASGRQGASTVVLGNSFGVRGWRACRS